MGRLIDADALIKDRIENGTNWYLGNTNAFLELVERQQTIQQERTAQKQWEAIDTLEYNCSNCGKFLNNSWKYCPNCGARFVEAE